MLRVALKENLQKLVAVGFWEHVFLGSIITIVLIFYGYQAKKYDI